MKTLLLLCILLYSFSAFAQELPLDKFYVVNTLFRKLGVRSVKDSFVTSPQSSYTIEYDTLGRELGMYRGDGARINSNIYIVRADTLYRLKYTNERHDKLYSFEEFIYGKTKKILKYTTCYSYYPPYADVTVFRYIFFYDEKDSLTTRIMYSDDKSKKQVQENMNIKENELTISDVLFYEYFKRNGFNYVITKEGAGEKDMRETDTSIFKNGRIIRSASFQKYGFEGEMAAFNIHRVSEYNFYKDTLTTTQYRTSCNLIDANWACQEINSTPHDRKQIIYDKNGLPLAEYLLDDNGDTTLVMIYVYKYY